ncbi:MAG: DUF1571 domain-containing protein [Gammaproteobacteria bacterium]
MKHVIDGNRFDAPTAEAPPSSSTRSGCRMREPYLGNESEDTAKTPRRDFHKYVDRIICSAIFAFTSMVSHAYASAELDPEEWLRGVEAAYSRVTMYTAVFHKQQRIAGKLLSEETMFLKCRKKPFSLYMKWIKEPYKGSELLYVAGWNDGRIRAHRGGVLSFIIHNLYPEDRKLMANELHPVTSTGIGYLLEGVALNMRKAINAGDLTFSEKGQEKVYGRNTRALEVIFPKVKVKAYDGWRFVINQDVESQILVRIKIYDQDDQLIEYYGYENLNLNAPLTNADFDPKNPEYYFW